MPRPRPGDAASAFGRAQALSSLPRRHLDRKIANARANVTQTSEVQSPRSGFVQHFGRANSQSRLDEDRAGFIVHVDVIPQLGSPAVAHLDPSRPLHACRRNQSSFSLLLLLVSPSRSACVGSFAPGRRVHVTHASPLSNPSTAQSRHGHWSSTKPRTMSPRGAT